MKFKESKLAHDYCTGFGVELGPAAHNPFNLDNCVFVAPEQRIDFWNESQENMCGEHIEITKYGDAENIPYDDKIFDYVISSHVIEHVPNPIKAFIEWDRVLQKNGIVFIIFPKRDADPLDVNRPINKLEDLINQYKNPQLLTDEKMHIWVWNLQLMVDLIEWCNKEKLINWEIIETLETDDKVGNGSCVVCRKR